MTGAVPPYDRDARLKELELDPTGWGSVDLGNLLAAWTYSSRPLGWSGEAAKTLWYHTSDPGRLNMVMPSSDGLALTIVEQVVWLCREARRLGL